MSQSGFLKWIVICLLSFCLAISGALGTEAIAAGKDDAKGIKTNGRIIIKSSANSTKSNAAVKTNEKANNKKAKPVKAPATLSASDNTGTGKAGLINDVRWSNHVDAVTGLESVRIVLDTSSPVNVQDVLVSDPDCQLVVTIKGAAKKENIKNSILFDGEIIDKVTFFAENTSDTKIVFDLPRPIINDEYKVFTLKKDIEPGKPFRVVIDINKPMPLPDFKFTAGLKDKVIVIDPGHGGSDPGAIGSNKVMEKNVTLAIAHMVKELLEKENAKVIMTRTEDRDVFGPRATAAEELGARAGVANKNNVDIFLSIHANSFTNKTVGGSSTYYYRKSIYDVMLTNALQKNLLLAGKLQDRRANASNFYVVKKTRMPATLIELAFISNPAEEKLLNSSEFQKKMAKGIVEGIKDFFGQAAKLRGEG